tara:strand:+ start:4895 stop:6577 length:1683 start_codon:yes stop_codon:yes gene_type:complete
MPNVASIIARELKKNKINDIFMLTGYGSMYLNDAIEKNKIKYYAARNEAAAPMMAEAYAKAKNSIGAVCVTAGPGATNALPGLAEAYVDSAPIIIISGQVEKKYSSDNYSNLNIRTLGTAEFSITKVLKKITKYSCSLKNPYDCLYEIQKCIHLCKTGRQGPVWIEIPLDVQSFNIKNTNSLKKFKTKKKKDSKIDKKIDIIFKELKKASKPIFLLGNGLKQSGCTNHFKKLLNKLHIPFINSRFANDLFPFSHKLNLGLCGIKGTSYSKSITNACDLIISLGCRISPTLAHGDPKKFAPNAKIISVNNDKEELNLELRKIDHKINLELEDFFSKILKKKLNEKQYNYLEWNKKCHKIKIQNEIPNIFKKTNPIDLYKFMYELGSLSKRNSILITDAGSNYYIGGQVWKFENKQTEISSTTNAAMGLSVPLSIGAAIANKKKQILSVTGDGSIELNLQELKTISHYNLNIITFVINNGGYVSMKKWQDNFFSGNRLDTEVKTGAGTLNFRKIANAFDLSYLKISKVEEIRKKLNYCFNLKKPLLVEVITDKNQKIFGKEF